MKLSQRLLICVLIALFGAPRSVRPESPANGPRDSGRFSLVAACSQDAQWLNCQVSARDLVYDNVLLPEQKLSATLEGRLGSSVQFDLHPAQGNSQRVSIAVGMADGNTNPALARVAVEVRQGEHVVQSYGLTFPVSARAR